MVLQLFVRAPGGAGSGLRAVAAAPEDSVATVCGLEHAEALHGGALRVVHEGRTLDPGASLAAAAVRPCGTLELLPRLRAGGGDGGSTGAESRSSYLEMYAGKKKDKVNPEEERLARWTSCQLSGMPLQPPCVCDELGSLFNKEPVLQALVTKSMPKGLAHITSLKHVTELKLEEAPKGGAGGGTDGGGGAVRFACPVTGQAFNGKYKFVVLRKSGHVLSERALKEVPKVVEEMVGGKWDPADLLPVNPSGEELQEMREQLLLKRAAERVAKKERKKDKAAANGNGMAAAAAGAGAGAPPAAAAGAKRSADNGVNGSAPAAAPAAEGKRFKAAELKPKGADDKVWNSLFTSSDPRGDGRPDYMIRAATRRL